MLYGSITDNDEGPLTIYDKLGIILNVGEVTQPVTNNLDYEIMPIDTVCIPCSGGNCGTGCSATCSDLCTGSLL